MMKEIIENTPGTIAETKKWRDGDPEMPLMNAVYNAKASILIDELNKIQYDRVSDIDDVNEKIGKLIDIMIRGIEFKGMV
jgi:hypothetical protein